MYYGTLKLVQETGIEPLAPNGVPSDDLLKHVRIVNQDQYGELAAYAASARRFVQHYTRRQLIRANYVWEMDKFPVVRQLWPLANHRRYNIPEIIERYPRGVLHFPMAPVLTVPSVTYYDSMGTLQTMLLWQLGSPVNPAPTLTPGGYQLDLDSEPARIAPQPGSVWPIVQVLTLNPITITFTAGYTGLNGYGGDNIPPEAALCLKLLTSHFYLHRASVTESKLNDIPYGLRSLIMDLKTGAYP